MTIPHKYEKRFTSTYLRSLADKASRELGAGQRWEQSDRDGVMVRVSAIGKVSFLFRYKTGSTYRRKTIGTFNPDKSTSEDSGLTLAEALAEVAQLRGLRKQNVDIVEVETRDKAKSVRQIGEAFLKNERRPGGPKRVDVIERILVKEIYPTLGDRRIDTVTLADISHLILAIRDRGGNDTARRTLFQLKKMWRFAELKFNLQLNPTTNLRPSDYHLKTSGTRERVLTDAEIGALWRLLSDEEAHGMSLAVRSGLKLILLTGVRSSEVRNMCWEHVDLDQAVWTIPPELHKAGQSGASTRTHQVPLTTTAVNILNALPRDSAWVLTGENGVQLSDKALTRALHRLQERQKDTRRGRYTAEASTRGLLLEQLDKELGEWVKFGAHDLRRTLATRLSGPELGVDPAVRERILAHSLGKLEAAYNRHDYLPQQRAALEKWEAKLKEVCKW